MKVLRLTLGTLLLAGILLQPNPGAAVVVGQIDTFQDGTLQNWAAGNEDGFEPPIPPELIPDGGPGGAGDAFMQITAVDPGVPGSEPGSRLTAINRVQWAGDYLAAGVNFITMSLKNTGSNNLQVRVVIVEEIVGSQAENIAVSKTAVPLPVGGDWVTATFPVGPGFLAAARGTVQTALAKAGELRIMHNPAATFPPPKITGLLGVDNIKAERRPGLPYLPLLLLDD